MRHPQKFHRDHEKLVPVRAGGRHPSSMSNQNTSPRRHAEAPSPNHVGPAFHWLRRKHRHVRKTIQTSRFPWLDLVREMEADGVVDRNGNTPRTDCVSVTWRVVERSLKQQAERLAAQAAERQRRAQPPPSRPSPGYSAAPRPIAGLPSSAGAVISPPPAVGSPAPVKPYDPATATPEEVMAKLKENLRKQDSRTPTFKERAAPYVAPIPAKRW